MVASASVRCCLHHSSPDRVNSSAYNGTGFTNKIASSDGTCLYRGSFKLRSSTAVDHDSTSTTRHGRSPAYSSLRTQPSAPLASGRI